MGSPLALNETLVTMVPHWLIGLRSKPVQSVYAFARPLVL